MILEISGENLDLAKAEIRAVKESVKLDGEIICDGRVNLTPNNDCFKRCALTNYISDFLGSCELNNIADFARNLKLKNKKFAVEVKDYSDKKIDTMKLTKEIGYILAQKNKVDLTNPEIIIRVVISSKVYFGILIHTRNKKSFESRKVQHRPFFSPISLHPKYARLLVNLARVKKDDIILDPFCGTGGILIEAGLMNMRLLGSDIDMKMIEGCKKNLEKDSVNAEIKKCDVADISSSFKKVDAVVTDPPYGRAASTNKEEIEKLYNRAFTSFEEILKDEKYISIIFPDEKFIDLGKDYFKLVEYYPVRIHKNLTRYFTVYKKE